DFGLDPAPTAALRADGPEASAAVVRAVLAGQDGPARRVVLANAAAALLVGGRAAALPEGVALAAAAIDSGGARRVLDRLTRPAPGRGRGGGAPGGRAGGGVRDRLRRGPAGPGRAGPARGLIHYPVACPPCPRRSSSSPTRESTRRSPSPWPCTTRPWTWSG